MKNELLKKPSPQVDKLSHAKLAFSGSNRICHDLWLASKKLTFKQGMKALMTRANGDKICDP